MTQRHLVIVLTLIAACLGTLFLYLRSTSEPPRPRIESGSLGEVPPDASARAATAQPMSDPLQPGAERASAVAAEIVGRESTAEGAAAARPDAALVIRCVGKPGGAPLAGMRVYVWKQGQGRSPTVETVEATRGALDRVPVTGSGGEVELELPSGFALSVYAVPELVESGHGTRELPALAPGERRTVILEIAAGDDLRFHGVVLARESRAPIAGARVLALRSSMGASAAEEESDEAGRDSGAEELGDVELLGRTITDADGRFDLATSSWKHPFVRIDAEGFGPVLFAPGASHATRETARVILLERAAAIEASVVDAGGTPLSGVTVEVAASGHELQPADGSWEYDSASVAHVRWSAETAGDGRCALKGLAANVALRIALLREGEIAQKEVEPVQLEPGETRALQWTLGAACKLTGRMIDQAKKPVARHELWLVPAQSEEPRYFNPYESYALKSTAKTDESGRFVFPNVGAGAWWIGPAPEANVEASPNAVAPFAKRIDVPSGSRAMDVEVEVQRGLYIRGRVLDSAGAAAPNTSVLAAIEGQWWGVNAQSAANGEFAVGPLMPGKFRVSAQGRGAEADSDAVDVSAGTSGVILRLHLGGILEGKVVDANGEGVRAAISLSAQHVAKFALQLMATRDDGSFRWEGLEPGAYDLIARLNDGRAAVARSISVGAGERVGGLVLALEPGAKIRLRYAGTASPTWYSVRSGGAVVVSDPFEKGKPAVVVVPRGKVTVEVRTEGTEQVERRELELAAGDDKEVVVGDSQ